MVLSLSVNVTVPPDSARAQPSGTLSAYSPPAGRYSTNAWLSGMSPAPPASGAAPEPQPASPRIATAIRAVSGPLIRMPGP
ncbi:hypothetical protein [Dactylosporangium sp. NPDC050588]|uniref:hypothetical protein n=1 Tax=Dactylosporangium sp. NPDC050588 TaxID=3157211 RepID=UPI0033E8619F